MRFSILPPVIDTYPHLSSAWESEAPVSALVEVARVVEESGFDAITVPDHVILKNAGAGIMGPRWCETLAAGGFLAGATTTLRVYTSVLVAPYRNPFQVAKALATIDAMSGGRLTVGLGIGHQVEEFELLGVPFSERASRADEYIQAWKALWTQDAPSFHGRHVDFDDVVFEPKPVQRPHPPLIIGGDTPPAIRRAARFGDGWHPWTVPIADLADRLDQLYSSAEFAGDPTDFEVVMPLAPLLVDEITHEELGRTHLPRGAEEVRDEVGRIQEAGGTWIHTYAPASRSLEDCLDQIRRFGEEVIAVSRAA
jgi:probable F420-dependent oxidoreductase